MNVRTVIEFFWPLSAEGHQWIEAYLVGDDWSISRRKSWVLVPRDVPNALLDFWELPTYQPLEVHTGLFHDLAALSPDRGSIQEFADQHGSLTMGNLVVPIQTHCQFPKARPGCVLSHMHLAPVTRKCQIAWDQIHKWVERGATFGDPFEVWEENIRKLRILNDVYDAVRKWDESTIKKHIAVLTRKDGIHVEWIGDARGSWVGTWCPLGERPRTLAEVAEHELESALNDEAMSGVDVRTKLHLGVGASQLQMRVRSLRDACWLQFAVAVCKDKRFRQCDVCGTTFEVSPEAARTNRRLCSPACKAKAHRMRRADALTLAEKGLTPRQIAKQVGSQVATVKKWLTESENE